MKSLHRLAFATSVVTALQLLLGGLVHNTRSSLACPDWPLCYGQVFPPMRDGILVEHSHRLTGATVGVLTILLLVGLWRHRLRGLGLVALGLVVLQGVLGGLTVILRLPTWISTTHLAISQVFFCTVLYAALRTREAPGAALSPSVRRWTAAAAGVVFVQMVLGAYMRHLGAGLACVEVPLCKGSLWPPADVAWAALYIHMLHRLTAIAVLIVVGIASVVTFRGARGRAGLRALAIAAPLLVCAQIALGLVSITSFLDAVPVTAHLGVACALLASMFALHICARGPVGVTTASLTPAERLQPVEALP